MSAPATLQRPNPDLEGMEAAHEWVEWIAKGRCTEGDFITHILLLEDDDPEVTWEVLALLDQLHRRRQIDSALFARIKARLQLETLGYGGSDSLPAAPAPGAAPSVEKRPAAVARNPAPLPVAPTLVIRDPEDDEQPDDRGERGATGEAERDELIPGALLKGRYRVAHVVRRTDDRLLIEAVDEVRAELPQVKQRVAIHVLSDERSREIDLVQRIYRLQALAHPAIGRIFDIDEEDGRLFFTMEWLPASSLQQVMQRRGAGSLSPQAARRVLGVLGSALEYAHSQNIFHGALDSSKVFITEAGDVRLRGFVLAEHARQAGAADDRRAFAWLAYEVLWCVQPAKRRDEGSGDVMEKPPGLRREQWRTLREALHGKGESDAVLRLFTRDDLAADAPLFVTPAVPVQAAPRAAASRMEPPRRTGGGLMAATMAGLVLCALGGYLFMTGVADAPQPRAGVATASSSAPEVEVPVQVAPVSIEPEPAPVVEAQVDDVREPASSTTASVATASPPVSRDQLELSSSFLRVTADQTVAKVLVRRRGNLRGPATFLWWTESGTAQADRDFASIGPRWEVIPEGSRGIELLVPLVSDLTRTQSGTFYVKIDGAANSGVLGTRTLAQVEIAPFAPSEPLAVNLPAR